MCNKDIICPNCGTIEDNDIGYGDFEPGDYEWFCKGCNKYFILNIDYLPVFKSKVNKEEL